MGYKFDTLLMEGEGEDRDDCELNDSELSNNISREVEVDYNNDCQITSPHFANNVS